MFQQSIEDDSGDYSLIVICSGGSFRYHSIIVPGTRHLLGGRIVKKGNRCLVEGGGVDQIGFSAGVC